MGFRALALALVLIAGGCTHVTTTNPIGTTVGLGPDTALYGTWKGHFVKGWEKKGDPQVFIHFLRSGDTQTDALYVSAPRAGDDYGSTSTYTITTAKLGQNHYFNAVEKKADGNGDDTPSDYIPVLYRLDADGTLTLCLMDLNKTVAAIRTGMPSGSFGTRVAKDDKGKVVTSYDYASIDAGPEDLDAFMAKPEAALLFEAFLVLKRAE